MLARYRIVRGKRSPGEPLPDGRRIDIRKHTSHVLHPEPKLVVEFLKRPDAAAWRRYTATYLAELERRFAADRAPFDALAAEARAGDVYLGCNCPTKKNPDVTRCHTYLALGFMKKKYPKLEVVFPDEK
jgi:hypothetical protein